MAALKKISDFILKNFFKLLTVATGIVLVWLYKKNGKSTGNLDVSEVKKINYGKSKDDKNNPDISKPTTNFERATFRSKLRKKN